MANLSYENQVSIRSTGKVVQSLDNLVAALRASGRLRFNGRKVTKEAVVNSVWLWLSEMDSTDVEASLMPYLARFESMLSDESLPISRPAERKPIMGQDETPRPAPKRKGKTG